LGEWYKNFFKAIWVDYFNFNIGIGGTGVPLFFVA
jgi:hypothetical protein